MPYNTTVTYKGITRVINPADLTSAAAFLAFYDTTVHQYTVAGIRRLTFHLTVTEGSEPIAIRDVQRIARQLQVGPYAEKTVVVEPPLRTTPRPGKRFHRGWRVVRDIAAPGDGWSKYTGRPASTDARELFVPLKSINPEGVLVAEPIKHAKKKAKKVKKAKKRHPATGLTPTHLTAVRATKLDEVGRPTGPTFEFHEVPEPEPAPITGYLHYSKGKEGNQKGKHRWELSALNRREVDNSGEGFTSLTRSEGNIDAITRALVNPKVTYDPEDYPTKQ